MLEAKYRNLEGVHVRFLRQIMRQREVPRKDRTFWKVSAGNVLKKEVTQYLGAYIDRRQATVAEWVALQPILEVCDREMGYK